MVLELWKLCLFFFKTFYLRFSYFNLKQKTKVYFFIPKTKYLGNQNLETNLFRKEKKNVKEKLEKVYLAKEGAVGLDPGVAPRDHPEIDGGD